MPPPPPREKKRHQALQPKAIQSIRETQVGNKMPTFWPAFKSFTFLLHLMTFCREKGDSDYKIHLTSFYTRNLILNESICIKAVTHFI